MMTPSALVAIATLTGEQPHPCKRDGITYAVSRSWVVWYAKDDWHAVDRPSCLHTRSASLRDVCELDRRCLWSAIDLAGSKLDLDALRQYAKTCGYTATDLAVRLGYSPSNQEVRRILTGNRPVTVQFAQRAVAAFGRGVLGGE
jgi:hypothetical protein